MSLLKCNNLFYVDNNKEIIKDISIDINEGDCISVVGQSGKCYTCWRNDYKQCHGNCGAMLLKLK